MDFEEHLSELRSAGEGLAEAATRADLDTPIPTCPGWDMRDLLRHMGDIHRWANAHVAERRSEPIRDVAELAEVAGPFPQDGELIEWFREGHARLVTTLSTVDPAVQCYFFLPAPSPLRGWSRRQAHETTVHRADAESASGSIGLVDPSFAVDGIDELLFGFLGRNGAPASDARSVRVTATDADRAWLVRVGSDGVDAVEGSETEGDTLVRGTASDLYLFLWNRLGTDAVDVQGDPAPLATWREAVTITWGRPR
jgi:uncharacterized protein (TIGR03083 family)